MTTWNRLKRHTVAVSDAHWDLAEQIALAMRPPMRVTTFLNWVLEEGLEREKQSAIAAGAIVVDDPKV